MKILITGSNGFIGRALVRLLSKEHEVIAAARDFTDLSSLNVEQYVIKEISSSTNWSEGLKGVDVVIHLASLAHVDNHDSVISKEEYRNVNILGALKLANQAATAGVKRFLYISSIGVNGNNSDHAITELDSPKPQELYAISKYHAELGLQALAKESDMEVVIIRPPLVYGPGAPGNFRVLVKWAIKSYVLPFGAIHNKRSFIALDNLINFIYICSDVYKSPQAANQVFLVSDNEVVSTTELIYKVSKAFNKSIWLLPIPVWMMSKTLKLIGKSALANRLFASLWIDDSKSRTLLGWEPVVTMDEQLDKIARSYLD